MLHTDALRKRLFGVAKTERLRADAYTPAVNETVYRLQREAAISYLRSGYSVMSTASSLALRNVVQSRPLLTTAAPNLPDFG